MELNLARRLAASAGAAALALLVASNAFARIIQGRPPQDKETVEVLSSAVKVECYRIAREGRPDRQSKLFPGCVILSRAKDEGPAFAHRLARALLDPKTYSGTPNMCMFSPAVGFRIFSARGHVSAQLCFKCSDVFVYSGDDPESRSAYGNFRPVRPLMIGLAKEALPQDSEIQSLKP